jgi:hypothetical protein
MRALFPRQMARLYNISQPTVSRIVAQQRIADQEARAAGARNARSPQRIPRVTADGGTSALPRC